MAPTTAVSVPYPAYLRVYEPLAAFPEPERARWRAYAERPDRPGAQDETRAALVRLTAVPPVPVPERESGDAFVAEVDGVLYVCPWRTRQRCGQALATAERELPPPVLEAALPPAARERPEPSGSSDLPGPSEPSEGPAESLADGRVWIRTALWHVPIRWFLLFRDEERDFGKAPDGPRLRYRTPMVQARRRIARALKVLRTELAEGPLVDGLVDVGRWLEEFHPRSLVELDYGGLLRLIPEEQLAEDHSAADADEGLTALRDGDEERAGELYERLAERWREVQRRQLAN
ncbi:hypothetical protein [Streptomyces alkaliterrae]|uniref:DUF8083 domain-containing protein n=1 Tax=Streptomyces alkaliterrae TaxID=2213162 RepID=A0A5P0YVM9_9ACTN|nr:hypothetical protein [Streptomyces alkaliterrae]MBB1260600.1 hypothetical protein [Streptomyces alkaliterrae]MQS03657.1 hypothetical protein [Streptomyces alkaliterrae]